MAACPCGFSRQEYWSGLPCPTPGDLLDPGIEPRSLMSTCICRQVLLPLVLLGKLHVSTPGLHNYFIYIYIYCLIYEIILFKKYFLILSNPSLFYLCCPLYDIYLLFSLFSNPSIFIVLFLVLAFSSLFCTCMNFPRFCLSHFSSPKNKEREGIKIFPELLFIYL